MMHEPELQLGYTKYLTPMEKKNLLTMHYHSTTVFYIPVLYIALASMLIL